MNELMILAGGLGTRLRSEVPDLPKCMAPVNGRPFIDFVIEYFLSLKIENFIFALGYKSDILMDYLSDRHKNISIEFSVEEVPLGTGGAIQQACSKVSGENVFIANGDTLFKVNTEEIKNIHLQNEAECTLSLKPMTAFDRFGAVEMDEKQRIIRFNEKRHYAEGLINGGFYALNIPAFLDKNFSDKFSFEKDYLEKYCTDNKFYASVQDAYFIDMGIPEDYKRAMAELNDINENH